MALNRPLLAILGGSFAVIVAALGAVGYLALRTGPLAERLVREAQVLARAGYVRPSHVTPALPGSFAEHLEPLMVEVLRASGPQPRGEALAPCLSEAEGSPLPAPCREALEEGRALMQQVLRATRAESGGLPEWLGALAHPSHASARGLSARLEGGEGLHGLRHLAWLAALETRLLVARGQRVEAVDLCLDVLALGRELAAGTALEGQGLAADIYDAAWRPCAEALDAAPVERKRAAAAQLARLGEHFPPLSQALKEQSASLQLTLSSGLLSGEHEAALPAITRPAPAPALAGFTLMSVPGTALTAPVDRRVLWHQAVRLYDELVAAADLPPEARRRAFTALHSRLQGHWRGRHFGEYLGTEVTSAGGVAERMDVRRLQHDALLALVEVELERADKGRWPGTIPARFASTFVLKPAGPGEAVLEPCSSGLKAYALRVRADAPGGAWGPGR